jgi:hypothetical protein
MGDGHRNMGWFVMGATLDENSGVGMTHLLNIALALAFVALSVLGVLACVVFACAGISLMGRSQK